jgi:hypothetical protein
VAHHCSSCSQAVLIFKPLAEQPIGSRDVYWQVMMFNPQYSSLDYWILHLRAYLFRHNHLNFELLNGMVGRELESANLKSGS